ncbi:MAG: 7-cyano-7-deazaguanine synthase QueC [Ignavibacteria bacterium]|nr:7-cyano-7-deazaguanine synthase QueC [Ignavibacteria bacterium]
MFNLSNRDKAIVLVSGGMDSLVTTAIANEKFELALLHINYGQRTESRELKAFNEIADYYSVADRLVVSIEYLSQIGGSSLTDRSIEVSAADINNKDIPTSYVPFRNANMLSIATSWAEVIGASWIFIGAVEEDSSGYPDCRQVFYDAFNRVIETGTKPGTGIVIKTPIIMLKKYEIVKKGLELKAPFELSWSCYKNEDIACGVCDSCALRLKGFQLAGIQDPIPYAYKHVYVN